MFSYIKSLANYDLPPNEIEQNPKVDHFTRIPNEVLLQIGSHLDNSQESSSLRSAVQVSHRFRNVLCDQRDISLGRFRRERRSFRRQTIQAGAQPSSPQRIKSLVDSIQQQSNRDCASYIAHDILDYSTQWTTAQRAAAYSSLAHQLHNLFDLPERIPFIEKILKLNNQLPLAYQSETLSELASQIQNLELSFVVGATESITQNLRTHFDGITYDAKVNIILSLIDCTNLLPESDRPVHVFNMIMIIIRMPVENRQFLFKYLASHKKYLSISQFLSKVAVGIGTSALQALGLVEAGR